MFHLTYALLIGAPFLSLMFSVAVGDAGVSVRGCMGVEHPDIRGYVIGYYTPLLDLDCVSVLSNNAGLKTATWLLYCLRLHSRSPHNAQHSTSDIYAVCTYVYVRTYVSVTLRNVAVTSRWNVAISRLRA